MTLTEHYNVIPEALLQKIDEDTVLLNGRTREFFTLNDSAAEFWDVIQSETHLQRVFEKLLAQYDVPEEMLDNDLASFVTVLQEKGLLEIVET